MPLTLGLCELSAGRWSRIGHETASIELAAQVVGAARRLDGSTVELIMGPRPRSGQNGHEYALGVVRRAGDLDDDPVIEIVNPDEDTSPAAITAWLAELDAAGDWIDLPLTAAELLAENRADAGS